MCAIEHEIDHKGLAWQYFLPSGPLAILPMTGNRSSIVWTEQTRNANAINALDDNQYMEILDSRHGSFLG